MAGSWAPAQRRLPAMASEKTALVTGANAGIGFEIALALAQQGVRVVMGCRDAARARAARDQIIRASGNANVTALDLDLSEPASIRAFTASYVSEIGQLDLLVHNAGVFGVPLSHNSLGWELHLATNYLGPFALTGWLLPLLEARPAGRIVTVGSLANRRGELSIADLNGSGGAYRAFHAYARSKLALLCFTLELNRRLSLRGGAAIALSAHPGFASTDIARNHRVGTKAGALESWLRARIRARLASPRQAAAVIVHAATSPTARGGDYYGPSGLLELKGPPARARVNRRAKDVALARQLWSTSEDLLDVHFLSEIR